jgi:hypothetical protein
LGGKRYEQQENPIFLGTTFWSDEQIIEYISKELEYDEEIKWKRWNSIKKEFWVTQANLSKEAKQLLKITYPEKQLQR